MWWRVDDCHILLAKVQGIFCDSLVLLSKLACCDYFSGILAWIHEFLTETNKLVSHHSFFSFQHQSPFQYLHSSCLLLFLVIFYLSGSVLCFFFSFLQSSFLFFCYCIINFHFAGSLRFSLSYLLLDISVLAFPLSFSFSHSFVQTYLSSF
jgi:hypothetical protein